MTDEVNSVYNNLLDLLKTQKTSLFSQRDTLDLLTRSIPDVTSKHQLLTANEARTLLEKIERRKTAINNKLGY